MQFLLAKPKLIKIQYWKQSCLLHTKYIPILHCRIYFSVNVHRIGLQYLHRPGVPKVGAKASSQGHCRKTPVTLHTCSPGCLYLMRFVHWHLVSCKLSWDLGGPILNLSMVASGWVRTRRLWGCHDPSKFGNQSHRPLVARGGRPNWVCNSICCFQRRPTGFLFVCFLILNVGLCCFTGVFVWEITSKGMRNRILIFLNEIITSNPFDCPNY